MAEAGPARRILTVDALGHSGDGIAETAAGRLFVPFALPGEMVEAAVDGERATLLAVLEPSPARVAPPCPHFGTCGGCALQHLAAPDYLAWKREQVIAAFAQRGIAAAVAPVIAVPPDSRRRAVLTAEQRDGTVVVGFHRAGSHDVVAITGCRVLVPPILRRRERLAALAAPFLRPGVRARLTVLAADNGLDVTLDDVGRPGAGAAAAAIAVAATDPAIARLAIAGEVVFQAREPEVTAGAIILLPPPGGFLQAVRSAEDALAEAVLTGIGPARAVADLFAGAGTFTFRLARRAKVTAVEGEAALVTALERAARRATGLKPVTARRRDLFRNPLAPAELAGFDAVVFDPPRAGAKAQAEALARSAVPRVVAVSCNPATLARDARILVDGGYRLADVQPVDQFLWSAHIEAVATFVR